MRTAAALRDYTSHRRIGLIEKRSRFVRSTMSAERIVAVNELRSTQPPVATDAWLSFDRRREAVDMAQRIEAMPIIEFAAICEVATLQPPPGEVSARGHRRR